MGYRRLVEGSLKYGLEQAYFTTIFMYTFSPDYDYEDPAPLIEISKSLSGSNRDVAQYSLLENTDMRCASLGLGSLRRGVPMGFTIRPRVSSPTRIEHPNLPPLNLYPRKGSNTLKRDSMSYRGSENGTLPKYAC